MNRSLFFNGTSRLIEQSKFLGFLSVAAIILFAVIIYSLPAWGQQTQSTGITVNGSNGSDADLADFDLSVNPDPMLPLQIATVTVAGAVPNAPCAVMVSITGLGSTYIPPANVTLGIDSAYRAFPIFLTDSTGGYSKDMMVPG